MTITEYLYYEAYCVVKPAVVEVSKVSDDVLNNMFSHLQVSTRSPRSRNVRGRGRGARGASRSDSGAVSSTSDKKEVTNNQAKRRNRGARGGKSEPSLENVSRICEASSEDESQSDGEVSGSGTLVAMSGRSSESLSGSKDNAGSWEPAPLPIRRSKARIERRIRMEKLPLWRLFPNPM